MDAKSSVAVPLSSPTAPQRCAEGAGLDSGTAAAAQSAMPSIAFLTAAAAGRLLSAKAAAPAVPQLQSRISTSLTDVTRWVNTSSMYSPSCTTAVSNLPMPGISNGFLSFRTTVSYHSERRFPYDNGHPDGPAVSRSATTVQTRQLVER